MISSYPISVKNCILHSDSVDMIGSRHKEGQFITADNPGQMDRNSSTLFRKIVMPRRAVCVETCQMSGCCILLGLVCSFIADVQIPMACYSFVDEHGEAVIRQHLEGNLLLHLVNLFDFSLIKPEVVQNTITRIEQLKEHLGLD